MKSKSFQLAFQMKKSTSTVLVVAQSAAREAPLLEAFLREKREALLLKAPFARNEKSSFSKASFQKPPFAKPPPSQRNEKLEPPS